jgi:hypothetical protein
LLQHESRGSHSTLTEEGDDVSIFSNSLRAWNLHDFRLLLRYVDEICYLLGFYAVFSCISVPTFRDNLWVSSSRVKKSKKDFLTIEDGRASHSWRWVRGRFSQNAGTELPLNNT